MLVTGKKIGPPGRANERLSNLILEGGKSQAYRKLPSDQKDGKPSETPAPGENGTIQTAS